MRYPTLHYGRANGLTSRVDKRPSGPKLTQLEEDSRGAAPRQAAAGEMANILLAARGSQPPLLLARIGHQNSLIAVLSFVHATLCDRTTNAH
jgi:hypothetical protein